MKNPLRMDAKGVSALFLIMAMMLLTAVGYVLSYLIPTKQKSVSLAIYSPQAFFIAQAGVEYGVRYSSDQGWRNSTDLLRLNGAGVNQRNLGNGRFTISYNSGSDRLTSRGEISNSSERRTVEVSNFSQFLRVVFAPASPAACWSAGTSRARFFIQNARGSSLTLTAFSASWTQTPPNRMIRRIDMDGLQKYDGNYINGSEAVNFNRGGNQHTILPNGVTQVDIEWNSDVTNGANIRITFYTATGKNYPFNLDAPGDGLPAC
ncbi:MAG: hypothetical protein FJ117_03430 [Deltaproteobacteria bacterium]|nr:hypothetical protein [Deltaproteobacteria bacterium]